MAVSCRESPTPILGAAGVTAIETSVAGVTVNVIGTELTDPNTALKCALPVAALEASPCVPGALLIVATPVLSEVQATWVVRSWVELSVYLPVAVNCCWVPKAMLGTAGATAIETKMAAVTVNVTGIETTDPEAAVIVVLPAARDVAKPLVPDALLIAATEPDEEAQVAAVVRF